jgi:hypothetical protein
MGYGTRGYGARGDYGLGGYRGGFLSKAFGAVRRLAPVLRNLPVVGGIVRTVEGVAGALQPRTAPAADMPGGVPMTRAVTAAGTQRVEGAVSPLGTVGVCGPGLRLKKDGGCTDRKRPVMNPMNQRAASRAITRIKRARDILMRIERGLPKRRGSCACRGRRK